MSQRAIQRHYGWKKLIHEIPDDLRLRFEEKNDLKTLERRVNTTIHGLTGAAVEKLEFKIVRDKQETVVALTVLLPNKAYHGYPLTLNVRELDQRIRTCYH